jgi:hypothetical protein
VEESRIENGLSVAREAIASGDAALLRQCIQTFRRHGVPVEKYRTLVEACPLALVIEAGLSIVITSSRRGVLTLGQDISWEYVASLLLNAGEKGTAFAEDSTDDASA